MMRPAFYVRIIYLTACAAILSNAVLPQSTVAQVEDTAVRQQQSQSYILTIPLPINPPATGPIKPRAGWTSANRIRSRLVSDTESFPDTLVPADEITSDIGLKSIERDTAPTTAIEFEQRRQEKQARYQALHDRLQQLIEDWKKSNQPQTEAPKDNPPESENTTEDANSTQDDESSDPEAVTPPPIATTYKPEEEPPIPENMTDALVDGPIDRIGLANNLYAIGEYVIALETYGQIESNKLSVAEQHWVTYQMAACYRKLVRIPEAQELYRRLAGEESSGWLGTASKWWLDRIDDRARLEQEISQYQQIIDSLEKSDVDDSGK